MAAVVADVVAVVHGDEVTVFPMHKPKGRNAKSEPDPDRAPVTLDGVIYRHSEDDRQSGHSNPVGMMGGVDRTIHAGDDLTLTLQLSPGTVKPGDKIEVSACADSDYRGQVFQAGRVRPDGVATLEVQLLPAKG
ncbi:MAG: hypothetical protein AAF903_12300 [Pseudomonadota bacterium]